MTAILGISAFYHDSAAALLVDGQWIAAAQEERFSRISHDPAFPTQAVEFCLQQAGLKPSELDHVVFYEKPLLKLERILETYLHVVPRGFGTFRRTIPVWLKEKLYQPRLIRRGIQAEHSLGFERRLLFVEHHEAHAASAFFPSPFEAAAILTADGVGEWATTTTGIGDGNRIQLQQELRFPDSLGLFYAACTAFCGFHVNGGEGKLMGLAPLGRPRYVDALLDEVIDVKADGSFRLNQEYFAYLTSDLMTSRAFQRLIGGPPRRPDAPLTERECDLAASAQAVAERVQLRIAGHLRETSGSNRICLAGGVALNCVANGRIAREAGFEDIWIQPAAGDAGGAMGAALFAWHQLLDRSRVPALRFPALLGPESQAAEIESALEATRTRYHAFDDLDQRDADVAQRLESGQVIGWFQGRAEFGPRALGNRSLLADPRRPDMQDIVNQKIKFREPFRPFAPVVLKHQAEAWFEPAGGPHATPYMLLTTHRKSADPSGDRPPEGSPESWELPAVTHVDGSARLQTVELADNPPLTGLLKAFESRTGCPVLLNTSLNVRGEPMVRTAAEALSMLARTELDALVLGPYLVLRDEQTRDWSQEIQAAKPAAPELKLPPEPLWRRALNRWRQFTYPVRWVVSELVLAFLFFGIMLPLAWVLRYAGPEEFHPVDRDVETYWRERPPAPKPSQYFRQF